MRRLQLFRLIAAVRTITADELPVIVGSQSIHAITEHLPEIALQSVECDFLLIESADKRARVNDEFGVFSDYQRDEGFYADALGLATAILPKGWQTRLKPLRNDEGELIANCVDVHDVAVSKLVAGREKDFEFISDIFSRQLINTTEFLARIELVLTQVENDTIANRLSKLLVAMRRADLPNSESDLVRKYIEESES